MTCTYARFTAFPPVTGAACSYVYNLQCYHDDETRCDWSNVIVF